jgi:hypothetical protein
MTASINASVPNYLICAMRRGVSKDSRTPGLGVQPPGTGPQSR